METAMQPERSARMRVARRITDVFAPPPLAVIALLAVAWRTSHSAGDTIRWAAAGAIFASLLPFLYLLRKVRRGEVTDRNVRVRVQRPPVILAFLAGGLAALVVLARFGASREMLAMVGAGVVSSVVALGITFFWKISIHTGVVAGLVTVFTLVFGPGAAVLMPLVPLVGWARVELRDHTVSQVIGGAFVGAVVSGSTYVVILTLLQ